MTTPPPAIGPVVATPLAHRKRRHSEVNGSSRPKVAKSEARGHEDRKTPAKSRQRLPGARAGSSTPANRARSTTPSPAKSRLQATESRARPTTPGYRPRSTTPSSARSRLHVVEDRARSSTPVRKERSATPSSVRSRLQVPDHGARSTTPVAVARSATPSSAKTPVARANGAVSPRPAASARPSVSPRPKALPPKCIENERDEDSEDDSEDGSQLSKSDIEDILDSAELEPYDSGVTDDDTGMILDAETAANLKQRLLKIGPQDFLDETLTKANMPPQVLGTAFGLDPDLREQFNDEIFLRILSQIVIRHYFKRQKLPQYNTLDDVAELLKKCSNIVVVAGAGISTSLGIPDFRSKGSGFYEQAAKKAERIGFEISEPEEVFDLNIFDERPDVFYKLAGGILPDEKRFSPTHAFIKLLQDKGKLLTCYTQNIDNLEESAGITRDKLLQCHGSFATATCRRDGKRNGAHTVPGTDIFPDIRAGRVARCKMCVQELAEEEARGRQNKRPKFPSDKYRPTRSDASEDDDIPQPGVMKPDITFFGEALPDRFFERFTDTDCKVVDLVLVLGTSLKVAPVSEMPNYLPHEVPHVYVSREAIRHVEFDVQCLGDCDDVVVELCRRAGWSGGDGKGVVGHAMVEAKDCRGMAIVVEEEGEEGCRWRVRREQPEGFM